MVSVVRVSSAHSPEKIFAEEVACAGLRLKWLCEGARQFRCLSAWHWIAWTRVDDDGVHEFNLNDGEGDRLFAAMSALQTIYSVLSSCDEKPEILAQLEGSVLPLVAFTIEKEAIELYDDCFDLLDVLTVSELASLVNRFDKAVLEPFRSAFRRPPFFFLGSIS